LTLLAACQHDQKQFADAQTAVETALRHAPEYPPAHRVMGKVKASRGHNEDAEQHFLKAIEFNRADARSHIVYSHFLTAQRRLVDSLTVAEAALACAPDDAMTMTAVANAYLNVQRFAEAEDLARRAYEMHPGDLGVLVVNGFIALRRGKTQDAAEFAGLAANIATNDPAVISLIAQVQMARSRFLKPLWFAMNTLLRLGPAPRTLIWGAMLIATALAFTALPEPANVIVGWLAIVADMIFLFSLPIGQAVVQSIAARNFRPARLKRGF
jgi:tetratricopeptide (TPR) repeat protein